MSKKLKTIKGVDIAGKRVIFRVAYDFTLVKKGSKFVLPDDQRVVTTLPTLKYLIKNKAKIIILTWLGRPKKVEKKYKLDPVARHLAKLLHRPVKKIDVSFGPIAERAVNNMRPGDVLMLENVRFCRAEKKACDKLAKSLSRLGELVVNDAFAQVHRKAASLAPLQKLLPSYAGFLLCRELDEIGGLFTDAKRPRLAVIGGVKVSTRLKLIKKLSRDFDNILLGGALANTIFKAQGHAVGRSLVEEEMVKILNSRAFMKNNIIIPVDVVVANGGRSKRRAVANVKKTESIYDIGPDTIELYREYIRKAKTIVWNGPMGLFEKKPFSVGTNEIAKAIAIANAKTVIGGGDTINAIKKLKLEKKYDFISTGGGAMLHYLEGKPLPGIKYIKKEK
jgi:phosphoglycerate kinase